MNRISVVCLFLIVPFSLQAQTEIINVRRISNGTEAILPAGVSAVQIDSSALFSLPLYSEASLSLPRKPTYKVVYDRVETHSSGNRTWVGYLRDYGTDYRVILTTGSEGSWGRVLTPDGEYLLGTQFGQEWLVDTKASGLSHTISLIDDVLVPSENAELLAASKRGSRSLLAKSIPSPQSTVDVMVVYTPSLITQLGRGIQARLDQLIALSNQAYIDSEIAITLRLVFSALVNYTDTNDNFTALYELSGKNRYQVPATLSQVPVWRDTFGADLVVLLRAYNSISQNNSCGLAWLGGRGGAGTLKGYDSFGYSVVSNGIDINWKGVGAYGYCDDLTFVHELGHNMGNMHDHRTEGGASTDIGVFPYSFGYGVDNLFVSIMGYPSSYTSAPRVGKFSNPNVSCFGVPCGISSTAGAAPLTWADNALSMNKIRDQVASYRPTVVSSSTVVLTGLTYEGNIFYTKDFSSWLQIPGVLNEILAADFNGDGHGDIAGLTSLGNIFYTSNLSTWNYVPGVLEQLVGGDLNGDGHVDLAGLTSAGTNFLQYKFVNLELYSWAIRQASFRRFGW